MLRVHFSVAQATMLPAVRTSLSRQAASWAGLSRQSYMGFPRRQQTEGGGQSGRWCGPVQCLGEQV